MKCSKLAAIAIAAVVSSGAHAGLISAFGADPGGTIDYSFDNLAGNSALTISNGTIQTGNVLNVASQPLGGIGNYWSVDPLTSNGQITFSIFQESLSFLWGSPDLFNELTVTLNGSTNVVVAPPAPGTGVNANSTYLSLAATGGDLITGMTFRSVDGTGYAFEVDNLRLAAVPEPGTYALLLAGLGAIGFVSSRRKFGR